MAPKYLTIKEIKSYSVSALQKVRETPAPTSQGYATVGQSRGGPFRLHYELYGTGDQRILWLSGHGAGLEDFHQLVRRLGLDESGRYTSLLIENRGIGQSESPWLPCSMIDLAKDALEVLDQVGWSSDRSVHVVGHSMGGMMAMRMALEDSSRIASLTFISTTSYWLGDLSLISVAKNTLGYLVPKSQDARMAQIRSIAHGNTWLSAPDEQGIFPTNGDAWLARVLEYKIHYKGAIVSGPACIRHQIRPEDLKAISRNIGASHIQILHGRADKIAPVSASERTLAGLGGPVSGTQLHLFDDVGHMVPTECVQEVAELLSNMINRC